MKLINKYIVLLLAGICVLYSCKKSFLDETPLTFYTPGNSLQTPVQFQQSINNLHSRVRDMLFGNFNFGLDNYFSLRYATDFAVNATDYQPPAKLNDYKNTMIPAFDVP